MTLPDIATLNIDDPGPPLLTSGIPDDILHATDHYMEKLRAYAKSIPYSIEPNSKIQEILDLILLRITQCVDAKDYDPGLQQWDSMLSYWAMLKYPIPKEKRIKLATLYYHICTTPGMPNHIVANCCDNLQFLTRSTKKLNIEDMRLPWMPVYKILSKDLFLTRRQFEISQTSWYMGYIAESVRRFFHPAAIDEMLSTFVPLMNGTSLSTMLASQYYLLTFLPMSHPQSYLPMLFRIWESVNSYMYDDRMLQFLSDLAEMHVDPTLSDPAKINQIPDDCRSEGEGRPEWSKNDLETKWKWSGLQQEVGVFSEREWNFIMCKCLASMDIPLADAGSLSTGPSADQQASFELNRLPKSNWRISSLAKLIVYSMSPDGLPSPGSSVSTPYFTPLASGQSTPLPYQNGYNGHLNPFGLADYLSAPLGKGTAFKAKTYLAGCKALDSLAKLIASTEGFFHPTNSGSWTNNLSAFVKCIVYEFNKRWHEEQKNDCKTPTHRRLTRDMKRELVKTLRTVTLLAMFSQDGTTVSYIQSSLKCMSVMEPDLILHPILERAVPALEALVETQRTIAVIKALGAVAPALVCRDVYYPGAKHLIPILELLLPGIDLNDPYKTFCTTAFLGEVAQYIKFGEFSDTEKSDTVVDLDIGLSSPELPKVEINRLPDGVEAGSEEQLSREDEDIIIKNSANSFTDWVAAFLRRVILLFENLPEEGADGSAGGQTEVQLVDSVSNAFSQICVHLSEPLYDMVLGMVFDYASGNVRTNAVRAIHQLVECIANANPVKTLAKFLPFCSQNIRTELEHGASSLRTTSLNSTALPSDATLHWNLAILRGAMYNDGKAALKYKEELLLLLKLLHEKTLSKRGFSSAGKLLSSTLLTLTHTYPLENKFVNPDEWAGEEFRANHHRYWGRLYKSEEVQLSWHVPDDNEIDFALQIMKDLIEPTIDILDDLIQPGAVHDSVWRNEFCRHLSFVRNAFAGIPTLAKEVITSEELTEANLTSDILNEIPEMIATVEPLNSGFALDNPTDPRHQYITGLKARFGRFLHNASASLLRQGEENTVDAVHMLIRSIRTYMLEYGDSRDSYYLQLERYNTELNVTRQYAGQKEWPRAVYVRRARLYHSARLHWNSLERRRGCLENALIDDVTEWCLWHYATVRESSQSLLQSLCGSFDGLRRRSLPVLYKALAPGTDDDRMKGALWTLNASVFAKYAIGDLTLANEFVKHLFACQHNEKPSVQDCVSSLADTCMTGFVEPCFVVYDVHNPGLSRASASLKTSLVGTSSADDALTALAQEQRIKRVKLWNDGSDQITRTILEIAKSSETHWKYAIVAIRCLRTLIRRDVSMHPDHVEYLVEKTYDSHATMRYYAQRAVMKISRYIKLRTLNHGPIDLALEQNHNPLRRKVPIVNPSQEYTSEYLSEFKKPLDIEEAKRQPLIRDKISGGWLVWGDSTDAFLAPNSIEFSSLISDESTKEIIAVIRQLVTKKSYWKKLSAQYALENSADVIIQDDISCVKSIFQLLGDEPFEALRPTLEALLSKNDKNKQRGAAEFVAGLISGSKHWPMDKQVKLWIWFQPYIKKIFEHVNNDMVTLWTSFFEYVFYNKDPRRVQPLVDFLVKEFELLDFNAESPFDVTKVLYFFRGFYEQLGWKFSAWTNDILGRYWEELSSEHDDALAFISDMMTFSGKIMWRPNPSIPTTEVFLRECRTLSPESDIMGSRGLYHTDRVSELVVDFATWREKRLPGVRAFQSTYDRVGVLVCRWLFQMIHDTNAMSAFDYILPLMPELFRFTEINDNDDLANRAQVLLNRMCGVIPPRSLINPILDSIFKAIQTSPSWRVRLKIIPLVQVFYFRQGPLISDIKVVEMMEVICRCLDDEVVEVREMAATTLSGILRVSPRRSVLALKERFVRLAKNSSLPDRRAVTYGSALRQRHAAVLGICALIDSYPYTIEKWMPDLITNVLAEHTYDPIPISTTVRKCASNFRKTHQDTWHEDAKRFTEDQLVALSTLLTGSSYYA
ncbi:BLM10 family protein [Abortiporus biennis]